MIVDSVRIFEIYNMLENVSVFSVYYKRDTRVVGTCLWVLIIRYFNFFLYITLFYFIFAIY